MDRDLCTVCQAVHPTPGPICGDCLEDMDDTRTFSELIADRAYYRRLLMAARQRGLLDAAAMYDSWITHLDTLIDAELVKADHLPQPEPGPDEYVIVTSGNLIIGAYQRPTIEG